MNEAIGGLVLGAIGVACGLIVMLGRVLTAYLRVKEKKYERMLNRRGIDSIPPPARRRRKPRTLAERIFVRAPTQVEPELELDEPRAARDTNPEGGFPPKGER